MHFSTKALLMMTVFSMAINASAQIIVERPNYGFKESRDYLAGFEQRRDSLMVGVQNSNSPQTFDFRSVYFDQSCPAHWSEDTSSDRASHMFSGANEIDVQTHFGGSSMDTLHTYYSTSDGNGSDTLWYHGFEDQLGESVIPRAGLALLIFPLKIGSQWTSSIPAVVDGKNETISASGSVDAYGTMMLSSETLPVLRVSVTLDFKEYREFRYYFISSTPYVSACFVALQSTQPTASKQFIARAWYSGPTPQNDHCIYPNLVASFPSGVLEFPVGSIDTLPLRCINTGDTTAIIDSLTLLAGSPDVVLAANLQDSHLIAGDSILLPIVYRPTSNNNLVSSLLLVQYDGLTLGQSFLVEGTASDVRNSTDQQTIISIYPNPANSLVCVTFKGLETSNLSVKLFDALGNCKLSQHKYTNNPNSTIFLDITSVPSGNYIMRVSSERSAKACFLAIDR